MNTGDVATFVMKLFSLRFHFLLFSAHYLDILQMMYLILSHLHSLLFWAGLYLILCALNDLIVGFFLLLFSVQLCFLLCFNVLFLLFLLLLYGANKVLRSRSLHQVNGQIKAKQGSCTTTSSNKCRYLISTSYTLRFPRYSLD